MIRNNILSFSKNLREAARYRFGLRNSSLEDPLKRDLESLLLSKRDRFYKLSFYNLKLQNIISANDFSYNIKNFAFFLYYNYKNNAKIETALENITKRNEVYFKQLNREIKKINDQIEETSIVLNSKFTKAFVNSLFKEKDFRETYDLEDIKIERTLRKREVLEFKNDSLHLPIYFKKQVSIQKVEVDWNKSFFGKEINPVKISKNTSFLHREDKIFHWIVKQDEFLENGQINIESPVNLSLICSLVGVQKLNQLYIEFASELPVSLVNNSFEYWNSETNAWVEVAQVSVVNEINRLQLFLIDEIETKKIRLNFTQKKYYDNVKLNNKSKISEEIQGLINASFLNYTELVEQKRTYKIYDLSIRQVSINFMKFKNFGYYREGETININKPLSFWMDVEVLQADQDTYIEKYSHIVLFGEEEYAAVKKQISLYENTARYNNVIAIPNSVYEEEELLLFKNKVAKCLFFPDLRAGEKTLAERIKVFKDGQQLFIGIDYNISLDNLSSIVDSNKTIAEINSANNEKISGYFHIVLKGRSDKTSKYTIVYDLDKSFYTDESKLIKVESGKITFDERLYGSVGFIRPRINMRSISLINDSSYIKKYKVYIEELEENESSFIEYEDFLERSSRSTSNVI